MVAGREWLNSSPVATEPKTGRPVVLWVSHDTRLNGAPRSLLLTLKALSGEVRSRVLLYQDGPLRRELERNSVPYRILRGREGWGRWTVYANWIRNFLETCWTAYREGSHLVYANSSARSQCLLVGKWMGIPTGLHIREMRSSRRGQRARGSLRYWITGWCADHRIAVSSATEERFRRIGPHGGKNRVVYDGISPEDFPEADLAKEEARRRLGIEDSGPWIGHIGSASRRKGVDVFLRMAARILESHPDAQFLVVGVEPNQQARREGEFGELCAALGSHLHWWPVRREVGICFRALDVFCTLSRAEPFGLVNLEAALHRVPCVASAIDGHREIHLPGQTGWLVPPENPAAAAAAVREILENPGEAARRAEEARQRVLQYFTFENYAGGVRRNVWEVLGGGAAW